MSTFTTVLDRSTHQSNDNTNNKKWKKTDLKHGMEKCRHYNSRKCGMTLGNKCVTNQHNASIKGRLATIYHSENEINLGYI